MTLPPRIQLFAGSLSKCQKTTFNLHADNDLFWISLRLKHKRLPPKCSGPLFAQGEADTNRALVALAVPSQRKERAGFVEGHLLSHFFEVLPELRT